MTTYVSVLSEEASVYDYLVLGSGVGKAIAYWLLKQEDTRTVTLADSDCGRAHRAVAQIRAHLSGLGEKRLAAIHLNAATEQDRVLRPILSQYDTVISAIPAKYNYQLAKLAIQVGTHFCDLGGVLDVTQKMLELDMSADKAWVSVVPDCGLMPGLGVMLGADLLRELGGSADDITIYVGGMPQKPQPPLYYQRVFSLEGLAHLLEPAPIVRNGQVIMVPAYSEYEEITSPALDQFNTPFGRTVETFITSGASIAPWSFQQLGVRNFCEKTARWPGWRSALKDIPTDKFVEHVASRIRGTDAEHPDFVYMLVAARHGTRRWAYQLCVKYDEATGLTAMEQTTGFSAAAVARQLARGAGPHGVSTPEQLPQECITDCIKVLRRSFPIQLA